MKLARIEITLDIAGQVACPDLYEIVKQGHSKNALDINLEALRPAVIREQHGDQCHTKRMISDGFYFANPAQQPAKTRYGFEPHQFTDESDRFDSLRPLLLVQFLDICLHALTLMVFS